VTAPVPNRRRPAPAERPTTLIIVIQLLLLCAAGVVALLDASSADWDPALFGLLLGLFLAFNPVVPSETIPATATTLPFFKYLVINFAPWLYVLFVTVVITGSSNAVNLTDGLDGLATGLAGIAAAAFAGSASQKSVASGKRSWVSSLRRTSATVTRQPRSAAWWTSGIASWPAAQTTRRIGDWIGS